jgi:hypothetical protein
MLPPVALSSEVSPLLPVKIDNRNDADNVVMATRRRELNVLITSYDEVDTSIRSKKESLFSVVWLLRM